MDEYTVQLDEREQQAYIALRFEPKANVLLAAARVVIAAQDVVANEPDGVNDTLSLQTALFGALRLAVLEYECAANPALVDEVD